MKEICARTGLSDRAVRLYMDSGLVSPEREYSYSGRAAIHFSEEDAATLETVAALVLHIVRGGRVWLWIALGAVAAAALALFLQPSDVASAFFLFEFWAYRFSLLHSIFWRTSAAFDVFLKSLKFVPLLVSGVLSALALRRK